MWPHENRAKYNRDHLRYPSDLTDDELEGILNPSCRLRNPAAASGGGIWARCPPELSAAARKEWDRRAPIDGDRTIEPAGTRSIGPGLQFICGMDCGH